MINAKHILITQHQINEYYNSLKNDIIITEAGVTNKRRDIIDSIDNNSVVQIIYNYDHRGKKDKNKRYAKLIRPFVFGKTVGESKQFMIRAFEYKSWEYDGERYTGERDDLLNKNFKSYTTTNNPKWKTFFTDQISFWDVLGQDDVDIPDEFKPEYVKNDKMFSQIIHQKNK